MEHAEANKCSSSLIKFYHKDNVQKSSLFYQSVYYDGDKNNAKDFESYCSSSLNAEICHKVCERTSGQSKSMLWYEMRFGRITASFLYEAAHCETLDGSLVEKILSQKGVVDTIEMQRGRELESEVLEKVRESLKKMVMNIKLKGQVLY